MGRFLLVACLLALLAGCATNQPGSRPGAPLELPAATVEHSLDRSLGLAESVAVEIADVFVQLTEVSQRIASRESPPQRTARARHRAD